MNTFEGIYYISLAHLIPKSDKRNVNELLMISGSLLFYDFSHQSKTEDVASQVGQNKDQ